MKLYEIVICIICGILWTSMALITFILLTDLEDSFIHRIVLSLLD